MELNRESYAQLIEQDIQVIENTMPDSLERKHIIGVLKASVEKYYPKAELDTIKEVIDVFGVDFQLNMADEELGELTQAINKIRRTFTTKDLADIKAGKKFNSSKDALVYTDVCSEIADVKIIIKQLEIIFSPAHIACSEERKLMRLRDTIDKELKKRERGVITISLSKFRSLPDQRMNYLLHEYASFVSNISNMQTSPSPDFKTSQKEYFDNFPFDEQAVRDFLGCKKEKGYFEKFDTKKDKLSDMLRYPLAGGGFRILNVTIGPGTHNTIFFGNKNYEVKEGEVYITYNTRQTLSGGVFTAVMERNNGDNKIIKGFTHSRS
jgi:hypothetical protein